jgi:hypothetical protein
MLPASGTVAEGRTISLRQGFRMVSDSLQSAADTFTA